MLVFEILNVTDRILAPVNYSYQVANVTDCWNYSCIAIGHPTRPSYSAVLLGVPTRSVYSGCSLAMSNVGILAL